VRSSYLSILRIHTWQIDLGCKGYLGRYIGVVWAAVDLHAVDAVLMDALGYRVNGLLVGRVVEVHTCGGPRIVPFQSDIRRSSPLSRPYEHASITS
jgi:hypothetical protein